MTELERKIEKLAKKYSDNLNIKSSRESSWNGKW